MIEVRRGSKDLVWIGDGTPQERLESDLAYIGLRMDEVEERSYIVQIAFPFIKFKVPTVLGIPKEHFLKKF